MKNFTVSFGQQNIKKLQKIINIHFQTYDKLHFVVNINYIFIQL